MGLFNKSKFTSSNQEYETPQELYDYLDRIYHFTRDVCASKDNAKCNNYWAKYDDCLSKEWDGVNWMNPPYKDMKKYIKKAYEQRHNAITVCLIPARTNTRWWHDWCMKGEVIFICGRPKFKGCTHGLLQPLAIVIFGKQDSKLTLNSIDMKEVNGTRAT
jgi:phage N-6-adenine-methyltransferase